MGKVLENVDLKPYTYFKIGGRARYFVEVSNESELHEAIELAKRKNIPFIIFGAASNILVSDHGYDGLVIRMMLRDIKREGNFLRVGAGVPNAVAVATAIREGLGGMEWAIGIPGTIGGSVRGNAGCFSGEMMDIVERVRFFNTQTEQFEEKDNAFCEFAYRESMFKKNPHLIITGATLQLRPSDPEVSQKLVRHYTAMRTEHQDIGMSSAGCAFKNVPWPSNETAKKRLIHHLPQLADYAMQKRIPTGFLVDHLGLKGKTIGHASVSKKHGNYLINQGGATAEEVVMLIGLLKERIHRTYDLHPEEEIQYVGF